MPLYSNGVLHYSIAPSQQTFLARNSVAGHCRQVINMLDLEGKLTDYSCGRTGSRGPAKSESDQMWKYQLHLCQMKKGGLGEGELALRKATDGKLMWASPGSGTKKRLIRKLT